MSDLFPPQGGYDSENADKMHLKGSAIHYDEMLLVVAPSFERAHIWMAEQGLPKRQCYVVNTNTMNHLDIVAAPPERVWLLGRWDDGQYGASIEGLLRLMLGRQGRTVEECHRA